jgi:hypothetical protein
MNPKQDIQTFLFFAFNNIDLAFVVLWPKAD